MHWVFSNYIYYRLYYFSPKEIKSIYFQHVDTIRHFSSIQKAILLFSKYI